MASFARRRRFGKMILNNNLVFKKKIVNFLFRCLNRFYQWFCPSTACDIPSNPRKILLCNFGNIGDLFIASKAIASLKAAYPNAEWGILISPKSRAGLELMGDFKRVHLLEHWHPFKCKAALHFLHMRRRVVREIRQEGYDLSIDLHPFYPNAVPFLRAALIPVRVGYASGAFGPLLTHVFDWRVFGKYLGDLHIEHLKQVGLSVKEQSFAPKTSNAMLVSGKYLVVHMCSSREEKNWKREGWIELIRKLGGWRIVLTGQGAKDGVECQVVADATGCLNLCNQTTLLEYAQILRQARGLISVDSMGVHLAAYFDLPSLILFSGVEFPPLWLPQGARSILLGNDSVEKILRFVHSECH
jgi:ADP-heptose:LPS heptosyltransferase